MEWSHKDGIQKCHIVDKLLRIRVSASEIKSGNIISNFATHIKR